MGSSQLISLFTEAPRQRRGPSAFAMSFFMHGAFLATAYFTVAHRTHIVESSWEEHVILQMIKLHRPDLRQPQMAKSRSVARASDPASAAASQAEAPTQEAALPQPLKIDWPAHQTLIQPELPPNMLQQQLPIPAALSWAPTLPNVAVVTPPTPLNPATTEAPSLQRPTLDRTLSEVNMTPTAFQSELPMLAAGSTSPVAGKQAMHLPANPSMQSQLEATPVSATVLSVSAVHMREGTLVLPPINEVAAQSVTNGSSTGAGRGQAHDGTSGSSIAANTAAGTGAAVAADADGDDAVSHIEVSKTGKFGVVVVGSSMAERYPESIGVWDGRMAYTVYVHAGQPKNWILQYSLTRAADAASGGEAARPDAPWPFKMVVPQDATGGLNANALMIHGFVTADGRFEALNVVAPQSYPRQELMLSSLRKWEFRPASQNGQATRVEVLLIIPNMEE